MSTPCRSLNLSLSVRTSKWVSIPSPDEDAIIHALNTKDPLSVSISVVSAAICYSSGVIDTEDCEKNSEDDLDRAVFFWLARR